MSILRFALARALSIVAACLVATVVVSAQQQSGWAPTAPPRSPRILHSATLLPDGRVLVTGGYANGYVPETDFFHPATGEWTQGRQLNVARVDFVTALLGDGRVLAVGGGDTSAEAWSPETGIWSTVGSMGLGRQFFAGTLLKDGRFLVTGGKLSPSEETTAAAEIFDPATNLWTPAAPMLQARYYHAATTLEDGRVLVTGGLVRNTSGTFVTTTTEIYDPATNAWTLAASSTSSHAVHTAVRLADGRVLVAAGETDPGVFLLPEVYDPTTNAWTPTGPLPTSKTYSAAVLLPSGRVLLAAGDAPFADPTSVEYDPDTNAWVDSRPMERQRTFCTLTLLADGRALCIGGRGGATDSTTDTPWTAEIYGTATQPALSITSAAVDRDANGKQRLVVRGTGFSASATVFVDGAAFKKAPVRESSDGTDTLLQTGKLRNGRSINKAIRPGRTVTITVANGDGTTATFAYTR